MSMKLTFAKTVFHARQKLCLTQFKVAERAEMSVRGYQHLEKGDYEPRLRTALKLMIALEISPKAFAEEVGVDVPVSDDAGEAALR